MTSQKSITRQEYRSAGGQEYRILSVRIYGAYKDILRVYGY